MLNPYKLGQLVSRTVQDHESETKEIGRFELDVYVEKGMLTTSRDKRAFCRQAIATHLASACIDCEMSPDYFAFIPEPEPRKMFNWPEILPMG